MHFVNLEFDEVEIIFLSEHIRHLHQEMPVASFPQLTAIIHFRCNQNFLHQIVVLLLKAESSILGLF
jgi:hypothetical protein